MSSHTLTQMVNEARTPEDYRLACLTLRQRIQAGQDVSWVDLHHLAVKGHVIAADSGVPLTLISQSFVDTYRAEPGDNGTGTTDEG